MEALFVNATLERFALSSRLSMLQLRGARWAPVDTNIDLVELTASVETHLGHSAITSMVSPRDVKALLERET
jgi:hypothetical protein